MSKLKSGDLVLLLAGGAAHQEFVNQIHTLGEPMTQSQKESAGGGHIAETHWLFKPAVFTAGGSELGWGESRLRKINGPSVDSDQRFMDRILGRSKNADSADVAAYHDAIERHLKEWKETNRDAFRLLGLLP